MGKFKDLTGKRFGMLVVLGMISNAENKGIKWRCVCDCGNEVILKNGQLTSNNTKSCGCYRRYLSSRNGYKDLVGKRFGRLTVVGLCSESKGNRHFWECVCDCGNKVNVTTGHLSGELTRSCGCLHKEGVSKKSLKDITGLKFSKLTVIERVGSKNRLATWKCVCDCGNEVIAVGKDLRNGSTTSCGCEKSKAETFCKLILQKNNIKFYPQNRFIDCKYKYPLPFDIYIEDLNLCIELDGLQHFEPVEFFGGMAGFLETQIRDQIKNTYCTEHNINLLRIPYTQFNRLEEILKENKII